MSFLALTKQKLKTLTISTIIRVSLCDPDAIRTRDLLLRRQLLYPAELRNHFLRVRIYSFMRKVQNKY